MKNKKIILFLLFSFVLSWLLALAFYITGEKWGISKISQFIGMIYMYMPFLSAFIVQKIIYKEQLKNAIGLNFKLNRWYFFAWLLPFFIAGLVFLISLLMPDVSLSLNLDGFFERYKNILKEEHINLMKMQVEKLGGLLLFISLFQALIASITINAIFGFGEEAGWRGFLFNEMKGYGFWKISFIIGLIWGLWHSPIIAMGHNYPQHPKIGVIMMILFCILYSPIFTYTRIKTKSVIGPSILHGSLNATAGIAIMYLEGGNDLTIGITGLAGFVALLIINLLILLDKDIKNKRILKLMEV